MSRKTVGLTDRQASAVLSAKAADRYCCAVCTVTDAATCYQFCRQIDPIESSIDQLAKAIRIIPPRGRR